MPKTEVGFGQSDALIVMVDVAVNAAEPPDPTQVQLGFAYLKNGKVSPSTTKDTGDPNMLSVQLPEFIGRLACRVRRIPGVSRGKLLTDDPFMNILLRRLV